MTDSSLSVCLELSGLLAPNSIEAFWCFLSVLRGIEFPDFGCTSLDYNPGAGNNLFGVRQHHQNYEAVETTRSVLDTALVTKGL